VSSTESSDRAAAAEFTAVALESLTEAVRRALTEHMRRGEKVPEWNGSAVVWVEPGEHLHEFPVRHAAESLAIPSYRVSMLTTIRGRLERAVARQLRRLVGRRPS